MLKITDLKINIESLGGNFLLVDVSPYYTYKDGEKTDILEGYRYDIALPKHKMEKLSVKIPISSNNIPLVDINKDEEIPMLKQVVFDGLEVGSYFMQGNINLKATATKISFAK
ncbi:MULTISPECIES: hypothetical protein [Clostridium]|uniref:hypothetical protein n=1 Tax=Clostridium TaxID=1485 RepID=UPI00016B9D3C|nr:MULTISPECIES: hypothetical protein [Clostridium]EDT73633.1 conserved hypothetical protein [Clostridium butyricum 5521]MDB2153246.1 hypothetical protein [Clostridium butyricum]NFL31133.1 hypothetical protein [Clostridium butyricum]